MFSNQERCRLRRHQLSDVICQLRFPEILIINDKAPALFQEQIRDAFPQYSARKEPSGKMNYQFVSPDGIWRVNLTSSFISLACSRYTVWEDFAKKLDKPLAAFIQVYKPAYFERIGLRYLNFISRKALALEGTPYAGLIEAPYLGILADPEVAEQAVARSSVDIETVIRGGCRVKIHAGPGRIQRNGQTDSEVRFIFDQDLFMPGNIPVSYSAGALQTLHGQAWSVFRGAVTDTLFDAMEPTSI